MIQFSVIVPVYNAEKTIERTLASFISSKDYIQEVILIDDGSTDNTFEKIDYFEHFFDIVVVENDKNKGPGPSRRAGLGRRCCAAFPRSGDPVPSRRARRAH